MTHPLHHSHALFYRLLRLLLVAGLLGGSLLLPVGRMPAFAQSGLAAPALVSPEDDTFPEFTPTFSWKPVAGAAKYRLEYTTDPTCSFGSGSTSFIETAHTAYTPTEAFANDVNYCWRVQARTNTATSPWSPTWSFIKRWYQQPQLLTPTRSYQYVRDALMSWTPVAGAAKYKVEISPENSFPPKTPGWTEYTANPFYVRPDKALIGTWYWRVTPVDASKNEGRPSEVFSFRSIHPDTSYYPAPQLVSPLYYYLPQATLQPHEDRTAALPVFQWRRTLKGVQQEAVAAYRLQVDDDDAFGSVNWTVETESLAAAPTAENPFSPTPGVTYSWRVCALTDIGGPCLQDPNNSLPLWSEVWRARFDLQGALHPGQGAVPELLRPVATAEAVETAPLFEWRPVAGAARYEIQVSVDPDFPQSALVDQGIVQYLAYAPRFHLDSAPGDGGSDLPYGTYYWRVRALEVSNTPMGDWSAPWRFQIAAQSHWQYIRTAGNPTGQWQVAGDADDGLPDGYELTGLYAYQSSSHWHLGFHGVPLNPTRTYGLYLDLDHQDGSGAVTDPRNNAVGTIPAHQPEYALYVREGPAPFPFSAGNMLLYAWQDGLWRAPQSLLELGGDIFPNKIASVAVAAPGKVFAVGKYGVILQGDGSGWSLMENPFPVALNAVDADEAATERWLVGDYGTVLYWNYGAGAWRQSNIYSTVNLHDIEVLGNNAARLVGDDAVIKSWNGSGWFNDQFEDLTFKYDLYGVAGNWAVGEAGRILKYAPLGYVNKWQQYPSPTGFTLRSVTNVSTSEGWAVGDGGTILHRTGDAWASVPSPVVSTLNSVSMTSSSSGWAVGLNGTIMRWDGVAWSTVPSPVTHHLYSVEMVSESDGWIVGDNGVNLRWNGAAWQPVQDPIANYIEVMIPNTAIGMEAETGSVSAALFSVDETTRQVQDVVPNGNMSVLDRFTSVSERMMTVSPGTTATGDETQFSSMLPFSWHWPPVVPWEGYRFEVALDPRFTSTIYSEEVWTNDSEPPYLPQAQHTPYWDFNGDNTYYWRVRPQYYQKGVNLGGAWSQPASIERKGFLPRSLTVGFPGDVPTFSWQMMEGAETYDLEVDNDPNFGSPEIKASTAQTVYQPILALKTGQYYLRVRASRSNPERTYQPIKGDWAVLGLQIGGENPVFLPLIRR